MADRLNGIEDEYEIDVLGFSATQTRTLGVAESVKGAYGDRSTRKRRLLAEDALELARFKHQHQWSISALKF
jgi:hypothetical protein